MLDHATVTDDIIFFMNENVKFCYLLVKRLTKTTIRRTCLFMNNRGLNGTARVATCVQATVVR